MKSKKLVIAVLSSLLFGVQIALAAGVPENVTGVTATAIDSSSIGLSWKAAKDAGGGLVKNYRVYYGTVSVLEKGEGDYEKTVNTPNNNTSFVVPELKANTKYYFAVTAISSDGQESAEYSLEANATTPAAGEEKKGDDTTSPTVTSVSATDKQHVKVVFSEAIQLPAKNPEASFSIIEQINPANTLTVVSATLDAKDTAKKSVVLETSGQTPGINYIVTAGVAIKDLAGNPIVSGSTDSGLFLGSSIAPAAPEEEGAKPAATPTEAVDCDKDFNCFLKAMADCSAAKVSLADAKAEYQYKIELTGAEAKNCLVKYTADKHPNLLFAGTDMECKAAMGAYKAYEDYSKALDTKNCAGQLVDGYKAIVVEVKDVTPPENITSLLLSFRKELEKFVVIMNWTASVNSAKDLVDQIMYMSLDRGKNYDTGKSLGTTVVKNEVANLDAGKEYTFKITTKDASGNESTGAVKSIRLPQTGAGIGLVLLGSIAAAKRLLRRKKENEII